MCNVCTRTRWKGTAYNHVVFSILVHAPFLHYGNVYINIQHVKQIKVPHTRNYVVVELVYVFRYVLRSREYIYAILVVHVSQYVVRYVHVVRGREILLTLDMSHSN